ncbi:MAG: response regulator transcription factor [Candidatus Nanopelagicales bacterium]|jgi:DNA-binding response OmpR family regulator|nr:response regulator transcription factor [Candidatus Nanopelagicales bacterium]
MADPLRVLVVDDEQALAKVVGSYLEREGFAVDLAYDGPSAVVAAQERRPDLVVLDLMLPGFDGIEVCRQIRVFSDAYIIMLTARDEEVDKVVGLSVGADDYLVKPFSPREMIARVRAMLRRPRTVAGLAPDHQSHSELEALTLGDLVVDTVAHSASLGGALLDLTRTEFDLLATMAAHPRAAFTRRQLIEAVWGPEWYGDEHVVDVHVGHLRRKLGDDATSPTHIRTVRGVGYGMASG